MPHLHKFAQICSGAKIDIALDLPPVAKTVNAIFAQDLRLCAKVMCSCRFGGAFTYGSNVMEICLFELSLHMTQISAQICCFVRRLPLLYKHVNLLRWGG